MNLHDLLRLWQGNTIKRIPVRVPAGAAVHPLALVTMVRNEADCLDEWITFHAGQGVAHFYIYDNESTDGTTAVLERRVRSGLVTVVPWVHRRGYHTQARAYAHALSTFGANCHWMGFIDVDEFMFCPDGKLLTEYVQPRTSLPALIVHRHTFGTSGHLKPPGSVLQQFQWRMPAPEGPFLMRGNLAPKTIVQPRQVMAVNGAHTFLLHGASHLGHDESGAICEDRNAAAFRADRIRINHYYTKDHQTFRRRIARGRTASNLVVPEQRWLELLAQVDEAATVFDDDILGVLPPALASAAYRRAS